MVSYTFIFIILTLLRIPEWKDHRSAEENEVGGVIKKYANDLADGKIIRFLSKEIVWKSGLVAGV